jgi:hypothetical protein
MYLAEMTTQHFHFVAAGSSLASAGHILLQSFRVNLVRNGATPEAADGWSLLELEEEWGIRYYHINPGDGFCEGERIVTP